MPPTAIAENATAVARPTAMRRPCHELLTLAVTVAVKTSTSFRASQILAPSGKLTRMIRTFIRRRAGLLLLFPGFGVTMSAGVPVHQMTGVTATGLTGIRVSGAHLVNAAGTVIHLRGINRSGPEYACIQGWGIFDGPNSAASVAAIASWKVNISGFRSMRTAGSGSTV